MEPNPYETTGNAKFKYRLESEHAENPPNYESIQKKQLDAIESCLRLILGVHSIRRTRINSSAAEDFGVVGVWVEIVRCADYSYPASVECCLTDAHGRLWSFVGKVPIVIAARLHAASPFPQPGVIACEVVGRRQDGGREVVAIDTERPWHVEATTGETRFEVGTEHVIEFNWGWPAKDARQAESGAAADGGLALDFKLLKASRGSFGPEVAAAAENVMRYLDGVLDQELLSCEMSNRPIFKLPRDYYFDMSGKGCMQLCPRLIVESDEEAQRIFANDAAVGLVEEICEVLDPVRADLVRSELGLERPHENLRNGP